MSEEEQNEFNEFKSRNEYYTPSFEEFLEYKRGQEKARQPTILEGYINVYEFGEDYEYNGEDVADISSNRDPWNMEYNQKREISDALFEKFFGLIGPDAMYLKKYHKIRVTIEVLEP